MFESVAGNPTTRPFFGGSMLRKPIPTAIIIALLVVFLFPLTTLAKKNSKDNKKENNKENKSEDKDKSKDKPYAELIKDYKKTEGLFTFYADDDEGKVYMALAPGQLDKMYLCSMTRSAGDGTYYDSGADGGEFVFQFKRIGKNVQMLLVNLNFRADSASTLLPAIKRGITNSIYGTAKIASAPDSATKAVLVEPAGFFIHDIANTSYFLGTTAKLGFSFDEKNSYFGAIKSFPENTEVDVHLHFNTKQPNSAATISSPYSMFHIYHYSITDIPKSDYVPRLADDRVGYFLTMYQDYSQLDPESPYVRYLTRWNLKKANPELPTSPPIEPIVFWLENTIPEEYRQDVREGILYWNTAFKRVGFENAIEVKQMPDSADWDPADTRYNVIRWIVFPGESYAVGPSHANPFTGEIYDADIRICADFIRWMYTYSEEFVEPVSAHLDNNDGVIAPAPQDRTAASGYCDYASEKAKEASFAISLLEARSDLDDKSEMVKKFVHQYLVDLVAHEVGHTLGLRHNFKASTMLESAQLNDSLLTRAQGMVGSTMDYNPANLAIPGETQGDYFNSTPGPYDLWAIEYGYASLDKTLPKDELPQLRQIADRSSQSELAYGTDEDASDFTGIDPECTRYDLGKDPIQFYQRRIALSNELWKNIESKFSQPDTRYSKLRRIFGRGFSSYGNCAYYLTKYIGGIYVNRDHIGTPNSRLPLNPVPAVKQREVLEFITKNIFAANAFEFPAQLLNKLQPERLPDFYGIPYNMPRLDYPIHNVVLGIQQTALGKLYSSLTLQRLNDLPLHYAVGEDAFTLTELFTSIRRAIWTEITSAQNINSFRRNLQRAHLDHIIVMATGKGFPVPEDARTLARVDLKTLKGGIQKSLVSPALDTITRGHLEESLSRINAALDANLERTIGG